MTPNDVRRTLSIATDARKAGKFILVSELPHEVNQYLERIAVGRQRPIVGGRWGWYVYDVIDILSDYLDTHDNT